MEMTINIEDYLSKEEIKEVAKEEIAKHLRSKIKDNRHYLDNATYKYVQQRVDEIMPNHKKEIEELVTKLIGRKTPETLSHFVFNHHYETRQPMSLGAKMIEEVVSNSKPTIEAKVQELISSAKIDELILRQLEEELNSKYRLLDAFSDYVKQQTKEN